MIPMGISQITSSILNAIGLEMKSLKNYVFSSSLLILSILFLPKYIGTYSLIAGYLLMSLTSSILNLKMLSKRSLVNFDFLKTVLIMLGISLLTMSLGSSIYHLIASKSLISLIIGGTVTFGSTLLLIYAFNIANIKIILFKKSHA